jgi:hypothetical protein
MLLRHFGALAGTALLLSCGPWDEGLSGSGPASSDAGYLDYVREAPEFKPVRQDPAMMIGRWDTWLYMPWRYRWTIGTGEEGGRFCQLYGINGGVSDHARGPLPWLEHWKLRFYNDHTAGKGALFLDRRTVKDLERTVRDPQAVRPWPAGSLLEGDLKATITRNVRALRHSPLRVAYALDDEISTGVLTRPLPWRIDGDDAAYARWLRSYYGTKAGERAPEPRFVTPDDMRGELSEPLGEIDLSPFLDRMTYNDSVWANLIGRLVEHCNREDPATPCGFVGGQAPNLWGGYDWAKLAKKIQFVEAYDLGSAQEILRSFSPGDAMPRVTTHFHEDRRGAGNDVWLAWHFFAHGNRGMIGWVEGWFEPTGGSSTESSVEARPQPWLDRFGATLRELGGVQGKKLVGAQWIHDGIAIYYSHPSIQVSWMLDAEPHGRTWPNRNEDHRLGTSHLVREAWRFLLEDAGLQYDFLAYDEVAVRGVPAEYKVLILPACYALSSIEAQRISDFAARGGTVVADFACGLFDPHGRGRQTGVLDSLFGVRHDGRETRADFFGGRLWVETDQDEGYDAKTWRELFDTVEPRLHRGFAVAERGLPVETVRSAGKGRAAWLNLSPQRYLMLRQEGKATAEHRQVFLAPVLATVTPWIQARALAASPAGRSIPLEITYWRKDGRTLVLVLQNVPVSGTSTGKGGAEGLVEARIPIEIRLGAPVRGVRDERTGKQLPDGERFAFDLDTTEAVFFSFEGPPPQPAGRPRAPGES